MAEYIEREALLTWFGDYKANDPHEYLSPQHIIDDIAEIPSADVAPVVHGRWETDTDPEFISKDFSCSVCEALLCDFDTTCLVPGENCFYYCPECGARMDGVNGDG